MYVLMLVLEPNGSLTWLKLNVYPIGIEVSVCEIVGAGGCKMLNDEIVGVGVAFDVAPARVSGTGGEIL